VYNGPAFEREGALIDLRRLAEREPFDYDVLEAYAMALGQFERHREAAGLLERIVEVEPERWQTRTKLGAAYATIGMFAEARAELQAVIDKAPADSDRRDARDMMERVATGEETTTLRVQQMEALRERVAAGTASETDVLLLARRLIEAGVQRGVREPIDEARDMLERVRATHDASQGLLEALAF
jgi:tetratricopeptide (TPR) repeat protein